MIHRLVQLRRPDRRLPPGGRLGAVLIALAALSYLLLPGLLDLHAIGSHAQVQGSSDDSSPADAEECDLCALAATLHNGCDLGVQPHAAPGGSLTTAADPVTDSPFLGCPIPAAALPRAPPVC